MSSLSNEYQPTDDIMPNMTQETKNRIASLLTGDIKLQTRQQIEETYPPRQLPSGAIVTRSAPSPTGFVHIGTIYMCLLNQFLACQTAGVYMLRIEDTDKKREIADGVEQIVHALESFDLMPNEGVNENGENYGSYGPYLQSERQAIYLTYALELLQNDHAYPCFATKDEIDANVTAQQSAKVRPGYYGKWALWRQKTDAEIVAALDAGLPFVLRFKSSGSHEARVVFDDMLKGHLELPQNDLDVPLIKADGSALPTYHLAHVVDDFLMKTTFILRGDEWLPSTPLHIQLCQALNIAPFTYAHFAPISIIDKNGGGKRKLSKRKDPEADIKYWLAAGYPIEGMKAYLLGLANSSFEAWYHEHPQAPLSDYVLSIEKLAASRAPLLDEPKLQDYCKDYIAGLSQEAFSEQIHTNAPDALKKALNQDGVYTEQVLAIERSGDKPRKDLAKWSDATEQYGYFFDALFQSEFKPHITQELQDFSSDVITLVCKTFLNTYQAPDDQVEWFNKLKSAAEVCGFATDNKIYKANPEQFKGNVADFARIIRVKLTGKNRTPDLYTIMQVMGIQRIMERLS